MGAAATAVFITGQAAQAEEVVHVYNWVDYIGETTLADFTKATGIKVVLYSESLNTRIFG